MSLALLLIDIQNDYFPGGAMEVPGATEAAVKAAALLAAFRNKSLPIIHVQHLAARPGATFFLPGTAGADIHPSVQPLAGETVFQKHSPSCFRQTPLLEHVQRKNITRLLVAGMMTQMCIDTTVRAAADLGFSCLLAHDACAARPLAFGGREVAAEDVQAAYCAALNGPFAQVLPSAELLASL
ncbi:MAG: cysteine hydrolase [Desulfobulbus sp.]|jgi:nicotinamidase-related amidase|uniref:cysteine hydrolase family protein n=1 Tax=Desulfobulbus sp. TaxID=895 RepID=UPI002841BE6B|nr:cysteine hydrolase family protein [Desulfobulbus sp.]MDR2551217.1 cysteine hydrolase [Desulfobulbus sp.]